LIPVDHCCVAAQINNEVKSFLISFIGEFYERIWIRMGIEKPRWSVIPTSLSCLSIILLCVAVLRSEYRHNDLEKRVFKLEKNNIIDTHQDKKKTGNLANRKLESQFFVYHLKDYLYVLLMLQAYYFRGRAFRCQLCKAEV
jgi:hypothetical protein